MTFIFKGPDSVYKALVYGQHYLVSKAMHKSLIASGVVESVSCKLTKVPDSSLHSKNIYSLKVDTLVNTNSITLKPSSINHNTAAWISNRNPEIVNLAAIRVLNETKTSMMSGIVDYLRFNGYGIYDKNKAELDISSHRGIISLTSIIGAVRKETLYLNMNCALTLQVHNYTNSEKLISSNLLDVPVGGPVNINDSADRVLAFQFDPRILVVPSQQRPLSMNSNSDAGYIGKGVETRNLDRRIGSDYAKITIESVNGLTILSVDLKSYSQVDKDRLVGALKDSLSHGSYNMVVLNIHSYRRLYTERNNSNLTSEEILEILNKAGVSCDKILLVDPDDSDLSSCFSLSSYHSFLKKRLSHLAGSSELTDDLVCHEINTNWHSHVSYLGEVPSPYTFDVTYPNSSEIKKEFEMLIGRSSTLIKPARSSITTDLGGEVIIPGSKKVHTFSSDLID
ncbi:MAG: hypothetical protein ACXVH2_07060 [Methanobacterium sp.]